MMKIFKHTFLKTTLLAICSAFILSSCDKDDDAPSAATNNLEALIKGNPELSIFQAALEKTRLTSFTQGGGPFTVFAPTNAAFAAAGINDAAGLAALDSNLLVQLVTYHIQAGARSYTEIPLGPNATMSTQGGFIQYASRYVGDNPRAYINGGRLSSTNNYATNGILHVIDRLLVPGFYTATNTLSATGNFKLFLQALTKTTTPITATYTILAIPNNVMTAAGYDSTSIANIVAASPEFAALQASMRYHLIAGRIFSSDFKAGNLKTVQGTNLIITPGTPVTVKGTNNPAPLQLVGTDLLTTTGVVHAINGVLKP